MYFYLMNEAVKKPRFSMYERAFNAFGFEFEGNPAESKNVDIYVKNEIRLFFCPGCGFVKVMNRGKQIGMIRGYFKYQQDHATRMQNVLTKYFEGNKQITLTK